jgi:hypothetical protein
MAQQTAIDWLVEQLRKQNPLYTKNELIQIAKEMEKEQHYNTWDESRLAEGWKPFQKYYNETYGTE